MKTKKVDYIILGGGCSALTFASELSKNNVKNLSFLIIEEKKNTKTIGAGAFGIIKIIKIKI